MRNSSKIFYVFVILTDEDTLMRAMLHYCPPPPPLRIKKNTHRLVRLKLSIYESKLTTNYFFLILNFPVPTFCIVFLICCQVVQVQQHYVKPQPNELSETVLTDDCKQETGLQEEVIKNSHPLEHVLDEVG